MSLKDVRIGDKLLVRTDRGEVRIHEVRSEPLAGRAGAFYSPVQDDYGVSWTIEGFRLGSAGERACGNRWFAKPASEADVEMVRRLDLIAKVRSLPIEAFAEVSVEVIEGFLKALGRSQR